MYDNRGQSSSGDRANRGIGQALVEEALRRGAKRVYAGTRQPLAHSDERVTPLTLDVTSVTQAFLPLLTGSRGAIVNNLSLSAFAPLPLIPAYSISKAAAFSLTQSLRALLAGRSVRVHVSESMAESWRSGAAKAFERQISALVAAETVKS